MSHGRFSRSSHCANIGQMHHWAHYYFASCDITSAGSYDWLDLGGAISVVKGDKTNLFSCIFLSINERQTVLYGIYQSIFRLLCVKVVTSSTLTEH